MSTRVPWLVILAFLFGLTAAAQTFDPLTPQEADQVRDTAGQLNKRVPLLLHFAKERLDHFEQIRTAASAPADRNATLYGLLRQYRAILPEVDDAVDDLASGQKTSLTDGKTHPKRVLDGAIATERQLNALLLHIQSASSPADLANYHFELQDCLDATQDSLQNAIEDRDHPGAQP
jgi:hypothetical protein